MDKMANTSTKTVHDMPRYTRTRIRVFVSAWAIRLGTAISEGFPTFGIFRMDCNPCFLRRYGGVFTENCGLVCLSSGRKTSSISRRQALYFCGRRYYRGLYTCG